ncbi:hypothetical protein BD626DRAFT_464485, partial [Schizophyllum amplum]
MDPEPSFVDQITTVIALQCGHSELSREARRSIEERSNDLRSERQLITAEVKRLQAEIRRLFDRRGNVDRALGVNQMLLAPIHRLPPELLSEVFQHAVLRIEFSDRWIRFLDRVLCRVCVTWRDVARGTPFLWTSIEVGYLRNANNPLFRLQLRLSRGLPLRLLALARFRSLPFCEPFFTKLSDADAARLECMEVRDSGCRLSRLPARRFNDLRMADVTIADDHDLHALDFLDHAPALRDFTVTLEYECPDTEVLQGFPIPHFPLFSCLTRLSLGFYNGFPVSAFIETLSQYAPSLHEISMRSRSKTDWEETAPSTICEMTALRTAVLNMYTHKLLRYIDAPVLDTVAFHGDINCNTDPTESLLDLLTRSRPPLRAFSLTGLLRGTAGNLLQCLEKMEGLRELR